MEAHRGLGSRNGLCAVGVEPRRPERRLERWIRQKYSFISPIIICTPYCMYRKCLVAFYKHAERGASDANDSKTPP
jgi:hypothetical protein